ncbi:MAG: hypothetical protein ACRDFX_04490 [Chloroflexota bacterium]
MRKFTFVLAALAIAIGIPSGVLADKGGGGHHRNYSFSSTGSGAQTGDASNAPNCQNPPVLSCTVDVNGTQATTVGSSTFTGSYTSRLTIDYSQAVSNGAGGYCAPATGSATITDASTGDTITQTISGTVCEVGATGYCVPHTFNGTYLITGGTGAYADATGSGTVTGSDTGVSPPAPGCAGDTSSYHDTGTIDLQHNRHGHGHGDGGDGGDD